MSTPRCDGQRSRSSNRATDVHGDSLPWAVLLRGFDYKGRRVPLVSQQGIFKPAVLERAPLSIKTTAPKPGRPQPYDDQLMDDGTL